MQGSSLLALSISSKVLVYPDLLAECVEGSLQQLCGLYGHWQPWG